MKRKATLSKARANTSQAQTSGGGRNRPTKSVQARRLTGRLEEALALIRAHPGIRPSELNRLMKVEQSDALRGTLIKRGLIRKQKDGSAMRYYAS